MTRCEFEAAIQRENISPDSFTLNGGLPCEQYAFAKEPNGWAVYYGERGQRTGLKEFATEEAAFEHLFKTLEGDKTTRR